METRDNVHVGKIRCVTLSFPLNQCVSSPTLIWGVSSMPAWLLFLSKRCSITCIPNIQQASS
eukprot:scaffold258273_cov12-Tisochrysis_lutea.AAC.1